MWFAFYCEDVPHSLERRLAARAAHLENIGKLVDAGRVLLAGPFPQQPGADPAEVGFSGSLIVADFPSLEAAREWIEADPYVAHGVFARVEVRPFHQVVPPPADARA